MILLDKRRYLCVWIKKIPSKNLIFNPQYSNHYQRALLIWEHAHKYPGNKQNFSEIFDYLENVDFKKVKTKKLLPLNVSFKSCLPNDTILSIKEYEDFLEQNTSLFSEKFIHPDSAHQGSSRHVLLGAVQVKGAGRNMLVSRVDYIHSWGGAIEFEGVYSYLISNYLNIQLPLGACPTFKVDRLAGGSVQFLRLNNSIRMAQYSPGLLAAEKKAIKENLKSFFGTNSPKAMLKKIAFHFSMSSLFNIYNYSMISENILVNGTVIDCESLYNGTDLNTFSFYLDLCIEGERAQQIETNKLSSWKYLEEIFNGASDTKLCNSSVHGPEYVFTRLQEIYEDLFLVKLDSVKDEYWRQLKELIIESTGKSFSDELIHFLRTFSDVPCEVSHREASLFTFNWKKRLKPLLKHLDPLKPLHVFFIAKEKHQLFIRIRFNIQKSSLTPTLLSAFNGKQRIDMHHLAAISLQENNILNSIDYASSLNYDINRAAFLLPFEISNSGAITTKIISYDDLKQQAKYLTKMQNISGLMISMAFIDTDGVYLVRKCSFKDIPKNITFIAFEISDNLTKFNYLTTPKLVQS